MGVYALTFTSLYFAYDCLMSFTDLGGFPGDTVERIPLPRQEAQETRVQFLGWEDPLEEEMTPVQHSCLRNPMDRGVWPWGCRVRTDCATEHTHRFFIFLLLVSARQDLNKLHEDKNLV